MRQHGRMPGGQAAVLAMGKLGGREMTAGSDLDLIIVYDFERTARSPTAPEPARPAILYALHAAPDRGAVGADRRGLALPGRHAAAGPPAIRGRSRRKLSSFTDYQTNSGLDLGASCADPRAGGDGAAGAQAADRGRRSGRCCRRPRDRARSPQMSGPCGRKIEDGKGERRTSGT